MKQKHAISSLTFFHCGPPDVEPVPGIFAHGMAEAVCDVHQHPGANCAPDLIGVSGPFVPPGVGEHPCTLHGKSGTFFYLQARGMHRGYVILAGDLQAASFARHNLTAQKAQI